MTEHQRRPQLLGQALELVVEQTAGLASGRLRRRVGLVGADGGAIAHGRLAFVSVPPGRLGTCVCRHAVSDAVQPVAEGTTLADRRRLAGQHQKRGLERVVGVVVIAEHPSANPVHHRSVAFHEHANAASSRWRMNRSRRWPSVVSAGSRTPISRRTWRRKGPNCCGVMGGPLAALPKIRNPNIEIRNNFKNPNSKSKTNGPLFRFFQSPALWVGSARRAEPRKRPVTDRA